MRVESGREQDHSQLRPACLSHSLQALPPPHLHGDPLPCPSRRSLGPAQPCCLPRKLCCSGASGRQPATPMSTSLTSPTAGVMGSASVPSCTPTGVCDGEGPKSRPSLAWPEAGLSLLPGGLHPLSQLLWGSGPQPVCSPTSLWPLLPGHKSREDC